MNPKYPVYIISKGRWKSRLTSKALERMNVPYKIVIEPQEYGQYASVINPEKILVLPFSNLGQGSISARNWVWEHSIAAGALRHWILDDNIAAFNRLNKNLQVKVTSGTIFACAEDFVDRYENVALAGFQYDYFAKAKTVLPPFYLNTRIYSCILIDNSLPYRWRGKYNEDTDLSLRVLKDGYCTVLFYAFIQEKAQTMTMKGGNTDSVYIDGDERLKFAQSLVDQHPDVARVTRKFNRYHHHVNYAPFKKNKLIKRSNVIIHDCVNNYGMVLVDLNNNKIELQSNEVKVEIMKKEKERVFIKVAAQLTFSRNRISLLAEEAIPPFPKGALVCAVSRQVYISMVKPLRCEIKTDGKGIKKATPVTYELVRKESNVKPS